MINGKAGCRAISPAKPAGPGCVWQRERLADGGRHLLPRLANHLAGCASTLLHGHACLADGVEADREPGGRAILWHSGMQAGWMAAGLRGPKV
jgi:hypothetical protein